MSTFSPKYNTGDIVFYIVKGSREIIPCTVLQPKILANYATAPISYQVSVDLYPRRSFILDCVSEEDLLSFPDAKARLIAWLDSEKARVSNLVNPVG